MSAILEPHVAKARIRCAPAHASPLRRVWETLKINFVLPYDTSLTSLVYLHSVGVSRVARVARFGWQGSEKVHHVTLPQVHAMQQLAKVRVRQSEPSEHK